MNQPRLTIALGALLILLGVGFYFGTGSQSVTALIPAFLGVPIALCGLLALAESRRRIALPVAFVFAVLGFAGTVPGAVKLVQQAMGEELARPEAALAQGIVAVLCLVYIVLAIIAFRATR